jgi:hypothetical protein
MEKGNKKLPYDIAEIVFKEPPGEPKSYQLCCESETENTIAPLDLFEIFLTIMMEGIFLKNSITCETLKLFNEKIITDLRPWLHSLGYNVNIDTISNKETDVYRQYYCKVILRDDPSWNQYFELHDNITKNYHYIFGRDSPYFCGEKCTLDNLFAIFTLNGMVYKISFNCI